MKRFEEAETLYWDREHDTMGVLRRVLDKAQPGDVLHIEMFREEYRGFAKVADDHVPGQLVRCYRPPATEGGERTYYTLRDERGYIHVDLDLLALLSRP